MNKIRVSIKGITPLLMHRFPMEEITFIEKKPPEEQAAISLYEIDGRPYIPGLNILRALVAGATYSKGKGRASLQKSVSAGLFVEDMACFVDPPEWVVDSRPVVIKATSGRIVRHRPRFDAWATSLEVSYDATLLTEHQVRTVFDDTGSRVGLLDFRPERKGQFGRFMVTEWEAVEEKKKKR